LPVETPGMRRTVVAAFRSAIEGEGLVLLAAERGFGPRYIGLRMTAIASATELSAANRARRTTRCDNTRRAPASHEGRRVEVTAGDAGTTSAPKTKR
jgi:hypothetical protein